MSVTSIPTGYVPNYDVIKAQIADSGASREKFLCIGGVFAMRIGDVAYSANKSGEGFGWKGVAKAADALEMSKGHMSKIVKVVQEHLQDALEADDADVESYILLFLAEHDSISAAYDEIAAVAGGAEPKVWSLADAVRTLVKKAFKEGISDLDVLDMVNATTTDVYGVVAAAA